jgi:hypothetical protein
MPLIRVARPFSLNRRPDVSWRFGIGCYDVDQQTFDTIMANAHLRHHLQEECIARGEALLQNRPPAMAFYGGNTFYKSLCVVTNIEPLPVVLWKWPAWHSDAHSFPFHAGVIEAAPGEQTTVLSPRVKADGKTGEWRKEMRTVEYVSMPFGSHYSGSGTPVAVPPSYPFGFTAPEHGDTVVFGVEATGTPLRFDTPPPPPRPTEAQMAMMQAQADAVRRAQSGDWNAIIRSMPPAIPHPPEPAIMTATREAGRPPPARAYAVEGFVLAELDA